MSIKFNAANANEFLSIADAAGLTLSGTADWTIGWCMVFDGNVANLNPQYQISTGPFNITGSLNIVFYPSGSDVQNVPGRVAVYLDKNSDGASPNLKTSTTFGAGQKHYFFLQHTAAGVLSLSHCPVLTNMPTDATALVADGSVSGVTLNLDGSGGFYIGARTDLTATRFGDQSLARVFVLDGLLSDLEKARIAHGMQLSDLSKTPRIYVRMDDASDTTDRGTMANTVVPHGTLSTGTSPGFAYAGGTPPAETTITASEIKAERIFQRISGAAQVPMSGGWTGTTQPSTIECKLYAPDGATMVRDWTTINATVSANGTWTASPSIPQPGNGKKYLIQYRSKNASGVVLATSDIKANRFGVGDIIACLGSSSAEKWFDSSSGTGYTPNNETTSKYDGSWATLNTAGAATDMAKTLAAQGNVPVALLDYGVGGSVLSDWVKGSTFAPYADLAAGLAAVGGKIAAFIMSVGSNDAGLGTVVSRAAHAANLRTLISNVRGETSQPNLPALISGFNRRPGTNNTQANRVRMAENDVATDANVYQTQTLDFLLSSDNVHLDPSTPGFPASCARNAYVLGGVLYAGANRRGPKIASMTAAGNTLVVKFNLQGNTDWTPTTGANGWFITDLQNNPLTYTVAHTDATTATITCSGAPALAQYLAGAAPTATAPIYGNGSAPLPLLSESDMAVVADSVAPVQGGTLSVTGVTTTGATLSWSAASDNVGVAGYEISTDGGTSYSSVGLVTSYGLTGLSASTTYQLRLRAFDYAGNRSSALSATLTTATPADTTAPQMVGSLQVGTITDSSAALSWAAATDNVGVTGYEVSIDGGTTYADRGLVTSIVLSGLSQATDYPVRVRAYDAVGNRSAPLSATVRTATIAITVSPVRIARFAANPRVAVFAGTKPIPVPKGALDELRYVGDFSADLSASNTKADSITVLAGTATLIGTPIIQGNLVVAKLSGVGSVVFRLTGANGEQWDRTMQLTAVDDKTHTFGKDQDDRLFYAFDFGPDAAMWNTTLASIQNPVFNGVLSIATPVVMGNMAVVKVSGLNTSNNANNSVTLTGVFANGEKVTRTIYFVSEVH